MITKKFLCRTLIAFLVAPAVQAQPACTVNSAGPTAALVELYTSEGCSSCPPADRAINALQGGALVVPLALHVTYWDNTGWRDPFGQDKFDERQRSLLDQQRQHVVYTPQFFVAGRELRGWSTSLADTIRTINARVSPVTITLASTPSARGMVLDVTVHPAAKTGQSDGALYVAVTESGLDSRVSRGENSGATLHHDAAARVLFGPVALVAGQARLHREVDVPSGWRRDHLQAVAFVQEQGGPAILQALGTASCRAL
ncbi:MAG: DUF1223 domain-containing protein [Pseudomonadota bacterium]|nr:DUF1223 domain-containing protein [Pseudomonadota bacterium]